jgi:hypothetical protein
MTTCSVCSNNNPVLSSYMYFTWIPPSVRRQVPNVVEELLNLPGHLLIFCVVLYLCVFLPFFVLGHVYPILPVFLESIL